MGKIHKISLQNVLILMIFLSTVYALEEDCVDYSGNSVSHGVLYVPYTPCSLCVCYHSKPLWCKLIFCEPPQYCKRFKIGEQCCQFECLDSPEEIQKEKERLRRQRRFFGIMIETSNSVSIIPHVIMIVVNVVMLIKAILM